MIAEASVESQKSWHGGPNDGLSFVITPSVVYGPPTRGIASPASAVGLGRARACLHAMFFPGLLRQRGTPT